MMIMIFTIFALLFFLCQMVNIYAFSSHVCNLPGLIGNQPYLFVKTCNKAFQKILTQLITTPLTHVHTGT